MVCVEQNPLPVNQPNEASKTALQRLSEVHDLCRRCNKTEDFRWRSNTVHDLCRKFFFDVSSHHPLSRNCLEIVLYSCYTFSGLAGGQSS